MNDVPPFRAGSQTSEAAYMDVLVGDFKKAMRQLAAGVVIVAASHEGRRSGLTATAVCSLTTDPPTMLVCINRKSHTHDYIIGAGRFSINALACQHQDVAEVFAGAKNLEGEEKFAFGDWSHDGVAPPRLSDALIVVDCDVAQTFEVSTHTIFIGRVRLACTAPEHKPLVYADRRFVSILS